MTRSRVAVAVLLVALMAAYFAFDLGRYLSLDAFEAQRADVERYFSERPIVTAVVFFAAYVAVTGLSLPGAAVMTLVAGALFGLLWGTVIVSFASSIGATLAFLTSRFLFRDAVQRRFGRQLATVNAGVERDGAFYLFTLRLVPAFPFFAINLLMGLTPIRTWTFYWVSQLGMLAGTLVYVNAGTQLAHVRSASDIFSPALLLSFALLGIFPLVVRKVLDMINRRKECARWTKPRSFERNLVVIGAGSAGLVSAYIAAAVKAKVTLVEKHRMGGDCLNTGCVPSKALIRSAKLLSQMKRSSEWGIRRAEAEFDFADVMERVQRVIRDVEPHDSVERYTALGVECVEGEAKIVSPWEVEVTGSAGVRRLTTRNIIIAAGAKPFVPPIPGIEEVGYVTSDTLWTLRELPRRLLVLGGGPIGCELAQCFVRFGSQVTQSQEEPRLLMREDPEISDTVQKRFAAEGIDVRLNTRAKAFVVEDGDKLLVAECEGRELRLPFDLLLCAVGRAPNTAGYGLEELGIATAKQGTIETNAYLQTLYPNIFACGDVAGPYQFTHTASHQAWYAAVNALFGRFRRYRADYSVIPWCTFTEPEVARVGLNETEAREKGIEYEVTTFPLSDLDRAITDGERDGWVKVLTVRGRDRILGATIVGEHAGDLIIEYIAAMKHGYGLNKVLSTIHIYPTLVEANRHAAGNWKRAHAPERLLRWLARFHAWQLK